MTSFFVLLLLFATHLFMMEVKGECNYIDFGEGFIYPTDICSIQLRGDMMSSSTKYVCNPYGTITEEIYFYSSTCYGLPQEINLINQTYTNPTHDHDDLINFNCNYNPNDNDLSSDCDLIYHREECLDLNNSLLITETIVIADKCSSGMIMTCDSIELYENSTCDDEPFANITSINDHHIHTIGQCIVSFNCITSPHYTIVDEISCGESVTGFTDSTNKRNKKVYLLVLDENVWITASTCGSKYDTYLYLLHLDGKELSHSDDSDECGLDAVMRPSRKSAGTYLLVVTGCCDDVDEFTDKYGEYNLAVSCSTTDTPPLLTVAGTPIESDCNFIDVQNDGPPILPLNECFLSIKADDMLNSAKYECVNSINGTKIIAKLYDDLDCSGDVIHSNEFVSYSPWYYNCNGVVSGCNVAKLKNSCDDDDDFFEYKLVTDQCSFHGVNIECNEYEFNLNYFEDDECENVIKTNSIIDMIDFDSSSSCSTTWDCNVYDQDDNARNLFYFNLINYLLFCFIIFLFL